MTHPVTEAITARRSASARLLGAPAPNSQQIAALVSAAAAAPDHGHLVPFRFLDIGPQARERLAAAFTGLVRARSAQPSETDLAKARNKATLGPVNLGVVARIDRAHAKIIVSDQWLTVGAALQNMVLAAEALGFAVAIRSGPDFSTREAAGALGLAADEDLVAIVAIGSAAEKLGARARPTLDAVFRRLD
jgi:nitroreductase